MAVIPVVAVGLLIAAQFQPGDIDAIATGLATISTVSVLTWSALSIALVRDSPSRMFVVEPATRYFGELRLRDRPNSLSLAGLVFGVVAFSANQVSAQATAILVLAGVSLLTSWMTGQVPERMSSAVVGDGLHWIGLAALLLGVSKTLSMPAVDFGIGAAMVALVGFSYVGARSYLLDSRDYVRRSGKPPADVWVSAEFRSNAAASGTTKSVVVVTQLYVPLRTGGPTPDAGIVVCVGHRSRRRIGRWRWVAVGRSGVAGNNDVFTGEVAAREPEYLIAVRVSLDKRRLWFRVPLTDDGGCTVTQLVVPKG